MAIGEPLGLTVLKIVAQRLGKQGIAYILSDSIAMNLYAISRMTRDIDIVIKLKSEELDAVHTMFENDSYVDKEIIKEAISSQ